VTAKSDDKKQTIKSDGKKETAKTKKQKEIIFSYIEEHGKITTGDAASFYKLL